MSLCNHGHPLVFDFRGFFAGRDLGVWRKTEMRTRQARQAPSSNFTEDMQPQCGHLKGDFIEGRRPGRGPPSIY